jgi:ATP adenylyltransferase
MDYILQADKDDGCFLCRAFESGDDEANLVLERREHAFAIFNRFPYNNGHMLIAPNAHKADLGDLEETELLELMRLTRDIQGRLQKAVFPHGFNIGINLGRCAGAGVPGHLHIHIVPRWSGDTNFMSVTARTKVIVQSLEALYRLLRDQDAT